MTVVEALAREVGSVGKALHALSEDRWEMPTRCPPMSVKDLVAHMARGAGRIEEMIAAGAVEEEPEKDAVTYFRFDGTSEAAAIVARAQAAAADRTPAQIVRAWDENWSRALRAARAEIGTDPVLPNVFGLIRLSEYLRTRIVEVVVHHMDLDDAVGAEPHPDAEACQLAADVLRGLIGTDLRPAGMQDVRFLLVGTGRGPLTDEERAYLGPLANRFPLFT